MTLLQKDHYTLAELAGYLNTEITTNRDCVIHGLAALRSAKTGELSFLDNPQYVKHLGETQASAVIIAPDYAEKCPVTSLVVKNPYLAYAKVAALFDRTPKPTLGIHTTAVIDPSSQVDPSVSIGANCVIGSRVVIGQDVIIGPGCVICDDCSIADGTRLYPNVTLYHKVTIGKGCIIHSGAVLGADGFGIVKEHGQWIRISQLGGVRIGDNVDIGANTTIDRGALNDTIIEDGVKIDNQVQIAHNVKIGRNTAVAGCTGIAGSAEIGKDCVIGGASSINGHIQITDNVMIAGAGNVAKSITKPGIYSSLMTVQPHHQWRKNLARIHQLDEIARRLQALENRIKDNG